MFLHVSRRIHLTRAALRGKALRCSKGETLSPSAAAGLPVREGIFFLSSEGWEERAEEARQISIVINVLLISLNRKVIKHL